MDAVDYLKTSRRMCKPSGGCDTCVVYIDGECCIDFGAKSGKEKETVAIVEQWAKDHPVKTRQSEFLKMFPKAAKNGRVLDFCPKDLDIDYMPPKRCENISCSACKTDYWNEEVTDNE
nr:MAG TPA: hypothetical protein [Caudoviricetes sp.]